MSTFIKGNTEKIRNLAGELLEVGCLNDKQFLAVVFIVLLIGGSIIAELP